MNKQFEQLAEQSGFKQDMLSIDVWYSLEFQKYAQKFAELIVRECAEIAMREDHEPAECILNHFGITNEQS